MESPNSLIESVHSAKLVPSRARRRNDVFLYWSPTEWTVTYYRRSFFSSISPRGNRSTQISLDPSCFREQTLRLFVELTTPGYWLLRIGETKTLSGQPASRKSKTLRCPTGIARACLGGNTLNSRDRGKDFYHFNSSKSPKLEDCRFGRTKFSIFGLDWFTVTVNILSFTRVRAYSSMTRYFLSDGGRKSLRD